MVVDKLDDVLHVRLNETQKALVKAASIHMGVKMSSKARELILNWAHCTCPKEYPDV